MSTNFLADALRPDTVVRRRCVKCFMVMSPMTIIFFLFRRSSFHIFAIYKIFTISKRVVIFSDFDQINSTMIGNDQIHVKFEV